MGAIGVQMQAIVMTPPDRADGVRFFQDRRVESARLERRRGSEAGRARRR